MSYCRPQEYDSRGECPNRMMHNKRHWDWKSFMTPKAKTGFF